ncbi:hypothetical protein [Paenibacillus sp. M2]|uniref:hypothetical protein n=1 Tax=Paenibacillus sp. M2 TaxID=3341793 RepID=UPI00398A2E69
MGIIMGMAVIMPMSGMTSVLMCVALRISMIMSMSDYHVHVNVHDHVRHGHGRVPVNQMHSLYGRAHARSSVFLFPRYEYEAPAEALCFASSTTCSSMSEVV